MRSLEGIGGRLKSLLGEGGRDPRYSIADLLESLRAREELEAGKISPEQALRINEKIEARARLRALRRPLTPEQSKALEELLSEARAEEELNA